MKRQIKLIVVVATCAAAVVLTWSRHDPRGFAALGTMSRAAPSPGARKASDITSLRIFNAALMRVNDSYVDPTRVDPKQMLLAALDQVQKQIAEVLVEPSADKNRVTLRVDTTQKEFDIHDVDSPWTLSLKMREMVRFIEANLAPGTEVKDLEYAATNGMLNTLDPHSTLLDPQLNNEMRLNTRGKFGGLGIVIGLRKGQLTVLRPMPGTPAAAAGIKAGDKIVRIEKESTVNMMLNDAVSRLRGDPDTRVEVWIQRADQPAKRIVLTRAEIQVKTIEAHLLKNNVGYVKLTQFSGNSAEEMRRALEEMKQKGPLKGVVLDLRGDPGGLLEQAIKVTDEFVDGGTIVTTVGYANKQREEKRATVGGQGHIPLAVLVDGGSASASEIVAGALKNLDRGVVIGSRTFGKGSVQMLYDNEDGSALKLTIAQYLTPGDVSIQSVGIQPDIALEQTFITKDRVAIFRPSHSLREQDLDAHLTSRNARAGDKALETVRFLTEVKKKKPDPAAALRDEGKAAESSDDEPEPEEAEVDGENFKEDYEIVFARDLVAQAKGWRRRELIDSWRPFLDKKQADEQAKIAGELSRLGVDWSAPPAGEADVQLAAKLVTERPLNTVTAGEVITLTATVTNHGSGPAFQVRGITKSEDLLFEDREFVFGRLAPGESRSWAVPVKIDRAAITRLDTVRLEVSDARSLRVTSARIDVRVNGLPRPRFAYAYQLIDDVKGNGDGLAQRGEEMRLHVTVKNTGDGKSYETLATLANKSGEGVDVNKGRFNVDHLAPGESRAVDFTFLVGDYKADSFVLQMDVYDTVLHEYVTDKLTFPVAASPMSVEAVLGSSTVGAARAEVRASPAPGSASLGALAGGTPLRVTGRVSGFYRVEIEPGRPGFVATAQAGPFVGGAAPATPGKGAGFTPAMQMAPPRLTVAEAPLAVSGPTFRINVAADDERTIADSYVVVSNRVAKIEYRKVFYRSNRKGLVPKQLRYEAEIPLWPGANSVTVVARQSNQVQAQQTLLVRRDEAATARAAAR